MKIFDSHLHLFSKTIIENVARKRDMCAHLNLQTADAENRHEAEGLEASMKAAGVEAGLALPTAGAASLAKVNSLFIKRAAEAAFLYTAGTLHPDYSNNGAELEKLKTHGIRAIKLCSFSQGFVLDGPKALTMFDQIQTFGQKWGHRFVVVLDTMYSAARYFGADPAYATTPAKLVALARNFPGIPFIGAHMGSLDAPFEEIRTELVTCDNLYLDTSNAAHTLTEEQFTLLLNRFGPKRILFGTDWPWFLHSDEIPMIDRLADRAGFSREDKEALFYNNIAELLGLKKPSNG